MNTRYRNSTGVLPPRVPEPCSCCPPRGHWLPPLNSLTCLQSPVRCTCSTEKLPGGHSPPCHWPDCPPSSWLLAGCLLSLSQDPCPPIAAGKGLPLLPGPPRCPSFLGPAGAPLLGPGASFTHHMPLSRGGGGPRHGAHSVPTRCSPTHTGALDVGVLRHV